jgi:hypothetical protein
MTWQRYAAKIHQPVSRYGNGWKPFDSNSVSKAFPLPGVQCHHGNTSLRRTTSLWSWGRWLWRVPSVRIRIEQCSFWLESKSPPFAGGILFQVAI